MPSQGSEVDPSDVKELWARLAAHGTAPTELGFASHVLKLYSVSMQPWVERIKATYLDELTRRHAHYKLVIAPYGGGKTHFLMLCGARALEAGHAVSYVSCTRGVEVSNALSLYRAFIKHYQLPGQQTPGLLAMLRSVCQQKKQQIVDANPPDHEAAFELWLNQLRYEEEYPESAFGRVMAAALRDLYGYEHTPTGDAAVRWLRGEIDTLSKDDLKELRLAKVAGKTTDEVGRNIFMSLIKFAKAHAGVHGTVVLIDEFETMFNAKGKALDRVLSAMRVIVDVPNGVLGGVPMLVMFSAVPDIASHLQKYTALYQRLEVVGASFDEGNNLAPQIHLERVESQAALLRALGERLIELGMQASGYEYDREVQRANVHALAKVAVNKNLDIDARRLFVKACVTILNMQKDEGEYELPEEELANRYDGVFQAFQQVGDVESEP